MESLSHSRDNSHGFSSRRSHASLQHISLAPLSPQYQLDDDGDRMDFYSPRSAGLSQPGQYSYHPHLPSRSYLSSTSVPTTPPLFSDSRNVSQTNLAKKKRFSRDIPMSDTNLEILNMQGPLHHHRAKSHNPRTGIHDTTRGQPQDNEWLLRAGLALSSTTREEKGQSWLVKRESSTSLLSDLNQEDERSRPLHHRYGNKQRPRTTMSTPMIRSRRGSNSHPASRHASRIDLSMTPSYHAEHHYNSGTPRANEAAGFVPDFVDESLRDQVASMQRFNENNYDLFSGQQGNRGPQNSAFQTGSVRSSTFDSTFSSSELDYDSNSQSEGEGEGVDEAEMQRLTRERGFGLGSWVDRLVEWTLFGGEYEYPGAMEGSSGVLWSQQINQSDDNGNTVQVSTAAVGTEQGSETNFTADTDEDSDAETEGSYGTELGEGALQSAQIQLSDNQGGWSDVKWLLRVAQNAMS